MRAALTLPLLGMAAVTIGAVALEFLRRCAAPDLLRSRISLPKALPLPDRRELPERLRDRGF